MTSQPSALPAAAIEAVGLQKTYAASKKQPAKHALKGVDITIPRGSFFGLLGPNGAGKSTFINILGGLVVKSGGTAKIWGVDIDQDPRNARGAIGIVPQELNMDPFFSPAESLEMQAGFYGVPKSERRTEEILRAVGLWDKRDAYARTLSGGMKRRLMIARALVHEPRLLILDEPTAGVDIEIRRSMWDFLRELNAAGTTIILTTHYLEEAENLCRNIAIIDRGRIAEADRMDRLLLKLQTESFVLSVREAVGTVPSVPGYDIRLLDPHTLEVEVSKDRDLNDLFTRLSADGIHVVTLRNKVNRLEELFMRLVDKSGAAA